MLGDWIANTFRPISFKYIHKCYVNFYSSKFLSCNDIILLVVHFFSRWKPVFRVIWNPCWKVFFMLILNLNCYIGIYNLKTIISSLAQKCRLNDHVCRPTYLALRSPPPPRTSPVPHIIWRDETTWIMVHCVFTFHVLFPGACMVTSVQLQLLLCKGQSDSRSASTYIYYHDHNWFY